MMVLKLANGLRVERARAPLVEELRKGAEWRANKLTASEYDETTWSARTFMALGGGAVLGRAGGGRGARLVGGCRPTSGALDGRRGA